MTEKKKPRAAKKPETEGAAAEAKPAKGAKKAPEKPAAKPAAKPKAKAEAKPKAEKAKAEKAKAEKPKAGKPKPEPKKPKESRDAKPPATAELATFTEAPAAEAAPRDAGRDPMEDEDEDVLAERVQHTAETLDEPQEREEPRVLTPEEQELAEIYGEEMGGGALVPSEFRDGRTSDEDRPMVPEINARDERHKQWKDRRDQRKARRDDRAAQRDQRRDRPAGGAAGAGGGERPRHEDRPRQGDRPRQDERPRHDDRPRHDGGRPPEQRQLQLPAAIPPAAPTSGDHTIHSVGNALGEAAWAVFASLRSTQPLPVKQLAAMMRKRGLIEVDAEQVWPHLKAALIGDERSYRQLGLRPRIVYRGRDQFAVGPAVVSTTAGAEASLASALGGLAAATHAALKQRLTSAPAAGFERVVHSYLVATGYQDIEWVKRADGISYAMAMPPDGNSPILVSARSGGTPVDRRGVGELRVGVEAKQLLAGLLLSSRELSEDAERELVRPGRSIMVLCGDSFIGALISAGVGVVTAAAPVHYVDDQFLDEMLTV